MTTFLGAEMSTSVRLPYSGKIKYNVPLAPHGGGGGSRPLRLYDFRLAAASALEYTDMNSLWLCVGRDPVQRFGGAWLLTAAYEVVAFLQVTTRTEFNRAEGKTYLRLWFVAGDASIMSYDKFKYFVVRVALLSKPDEVFLTLGAAPSCTAPTAPLDFMGMPPAAACSPPEQWKLYYPSFPAPPVQQQQQQLQFGRPPPPPPQPQPQPQPQPHAATSRGAIFNPWGEQLMPAAHAPHAHAPAAVPPPPNYPPPPLAQPLLAKRPRGDVVVPNGVPSGFGSGVANYGIAAASPPQPEEGELYEPYVVVRDV